jgi:flagellar protein FliS
MEQPGVTYGSTASHAAQTYQTQDIETADPVGLVVRVFEEASRNLAQARAALKAEKTAAKGERIHRVCLCLGVLQSALDMKRGDEVARNLDRLYTYLQRRLTEGHLQNDDGALEEVANHLTELGAAWRQAARHRTRANDAVDR